MELLLWDVAVLIWLLVFASMGAKKGLIMSLGGLCVTILGYLLGFWAVEQYAPSVANVLGINTLVANVVVFLLAFLVVRLVGGLVLRLINGVGHLPVLRQMNGLGGGAMGFLRGILMLLLVGQVLVLAGLTPDSAALQSTFVAKFFFNGFL